MRLPSVELQLPEWTEEFFRDPEAAYPSAKDRMQLVIELARSNVDHGTGGPFGAAIFERETGKLLAPGVNLVTTANCSVAHAEIVAIMVAQRVIGSFDLGGRGQPAYELVTSTEPCAMCLGAIPWSGVRYVACGARDEDARAVGFDEGSKLENWASTLEERGIGVTQDVCRKDAAAVLRYYAEKGGEIYNSRKGAL